MLGNVSDYLVQTVLMWLLPFLLFSHKQNRTFTESRPWLSLSIIVFIGMLSQGNKRVMYCPMLQWVTDRSIWKIKNILSKYPSLVRVNYMAYAEWATSGSHWFSTNYICIFNILLARPLLLLCHPIKFCFFLYANIWKSPVMHKIQQMKETILQGIMAQGGRGRWICESEASLLYIVYPRVASTTEWDPVLR